MENEQYQNLMNAIIGVKEDLRQEMRESIEALRQEMREADNALRQEMRESNKSLKDEIAELRADMKKMDQRLRKTNKKLNEQGQTLTRMMNKLSEHDIMFDNLKQEINEVKEQIVIEKSNLIVFIGGQRKLIEARTDKKIDDLRQEFKLGLDFSLT